MSLPYGGQLITDRYNRKLLLHVNNSISYLCETRVQKYPQLTRESRAKIFSSDPRIAFRKYPPTKSMHVEQSYCSSARTAM